MSSEGDKNLVIDALAKTAKPRPRFDTNWPCPPEGDATPVSHSDIDLNRLKNGIDSGDFTEFALEDVIGLGKPVGVCGKKRSAWTSAQTAAIDANEGRPVTVEGFLALVKNGTTLEGGRKEGPESCNCHGQENAIA